MGEPTKDRTTLRDLTLPLRLVIAAFLIAVGLGYLSAMVQLKVQLASPGQFPPTEDDVVAAYAGKKVSQFERLLTANEHKPFNGQGSMRAAFTTKKMNKSKWNRLIADKAKETDTKVESNEDKLKSLVLQDKDGERRALIEWIALEPEARKKAYDDDKFEAGEKLKDVKVTSTFVSEEGGKRFIKVGEILKVRCVTCHYDGGGDTAAQYPLEKYEEIEPYLELEPQGGMSLPKLAQTTHVHLFGFSILWGLTGFIFALTSYPGLLRGLIAPLALVASVADVACWWLSRLDTYGPQFARAITFTGGAVALGLFLQITLSLFDMFGKVGKTIVVLAILAGIGGGGYLYVEKIEPYLKKEAGAAASKEK